MALFRCASGGGGGGQITVTYDSDFYGETITCTRGQKVYSKVASSSGSVVFVVNEEGDWLIECTIGQDTYSTTASIEFTTSTELVSIPDGTTVLPTDDVATWLLCAGIQDKSYTTLTEVLADSETFNALLGDSNACAYMARSTTWTTDICASQYAMSMIGQYDVCCDALLGNATWAQAIINSSYADYVVNISVPTMTSDTAPSGTVVYSSQMTTGNVGYGWWAFNNSDSNGWYPGSQNTGEYIGYIFANAFDLKAVHIVTYDNQSLITNNQSITLTLQGSNTGNTNDWSDIKDITVEIQRATRKEYVDVVSDTTNYKAYRLISKSKALWIDGSYIAHFAIINFYGHASSGEKIHGTYSESAYYLDDGTEVVIADPSTLSAGTYTFGSTKAKNPNDLTADYTKTIRITPNTVEIVLRPDNALYWWGYESANLEDISTANGWNGGMVSGLPTHNDYDISFANSGVGAKQAVTPSKAYIICKSTSLYDGQHGMQLQGYTAKNNVNGTEIMVNKTQNVVNTVQCVSTDCTGQSGYPYSRTPNLAASGNLYALWYE